MLPNQKVCKMLQINREAMSEEVSILSHSMSWKNMNVSFPLKTDNLFHKWISGKDDVRVLTCERKERLALIQEPFVRPWFKNRLLGPDSSVTFVNRHTVLSVNCG